MNETIVLLHGFSGTRRAWDGVAALLDPERYRPLALDLPGHGERADDRWPITFKACVEAVLEAAPKRFALCGYSLGGRVALHVALAAPERVSRLTVIAANPGIEDLKVRAERLAADERLAQRLESEPFEDFIESWRTQPLFAEDPPAVGEMARADQRRNDQLAMAAVMRGLSVGAMAPLWDRLGEFEMPVAFVAGTRDEKFRAIGERFAAECPPSTLKVVEGGHGLPLENPEAVAASLS
ncbi:MAG TPA: alpha/beta fold hydrolase [Solirubrobacteraceae bacterium]|nr:alpha/beta fold hydrolase [Solirubrobacteraceae bacterium]